MKPYSFEFRFDFFFEMRQFVIEFPVLGRTIRPVPLRGHTGRPEGACFHNDYSWYKIKVLMIDSLLISI